MIKLLVCILGIFGISVCLLQLRQERLRIRYDMNVLHQKIEASQAKLWNQQLRIASVTTPAALNRELGGKLGGASPSKPAPVPEAPKDRDEDN